MSDYTPREIQEILEAMLVDKASRPALNVLTNPSDTSIWYNILGVVAAEVNILENNGVVLFNEVDQRAAEIPPGTLLWYAAETLKFQLGDSLEIIDGIPQYAIIDESKQIIKASAAVEQSGFLIIKCAKEDISGNLEPLSVGELSGVTQYWIEKRFPGTALVIFSVDPDIISNELRIEIDGQILSTTGESLATPGIYPVEDAIIQYYKDLDFNGRFSVMSMIDAAQSVTGVKNVAPTEVKAKADGGATFIIITDDPDQVYLSVAGYMIEDPANILRDTITYFIG